MRLQLAYWDYYIFMYGVAERCADDMRLVRQEDTPQIAFVLPFPFGVILSRYALAVTLGYKARETIWRNLKNLNRTIR
jgi:hypothetical protein